MDEHRNGYSEGTMLMANVALFVIGTVPVCTATEHEPALEFVQSEYTLTVDGEVSPVNRYKKFRVVESVDHLSAYSTEHAVDHVRLNEGWFMIETSPGKPLSARVLAARDDESVKLLTQCSGRPGIAGQPMEYVLPKYRAHGALEAHVALETIVVFQIDLLDRSVEELTQQMLLDEQRIFGEGFVWMRGSECATFSGHPRPLDPETQTYSRVLWDVFDLAGNTYLVFDTMWYEVEKLEVFVVEGAEIHEIGRIEIRGN